MKINYHAKNIVLTDSMKSYAETKLEHLNKYFDDASLLNFEVNIKIEKNKQIVEITLRNRKQVVRVSAATENYYDSLNEAYNLLKRKFAKHKKYLGINRRKKTEQMPDLDLLFIEELEREEDYNPEDSENLITKVKHLPEDMKPMSPSEACENLQLLGHDFYVFNNAESGTISVIYKRNTGYGILIS